MLIPFSLASLIWLGVCVGGSEREHPSCDESEESCASAWSGQNVNGVTVRDQCMMWLGLNDVTKMISGYSKTFLWSMMCIMIYCICAVGFLTSCQLNSSVPFINKPFHDTLMPTKII